MIENQGTTAINQSILWTKLLDDLCALYSAYLSCHWRSAGGSYYGDHLLFQKMYENIRDEIDSVAERSLGITGDDSIVDPMRISAGTVLSLKSLVMPGELPASMLQAEQKFLLNIKSIKATMEQNRSLTDGVEDLIQSVASKHEEHVYLLSRRVRETENQGMTALRVFVQESFKKRKKKKKQKKKQRFWYAGHGFNDVGTGSSDGCGE